MKVADQIAQWLAGRGLKHAFGIIGGGNVTLWDAITRLGKTELVCCHHEQAAAMAASYYARSTGNIGVALVTTGAGSSNAITGVLAAHMDGSPLLVISGNEASKYMEKPTRVWGVQGYDSAGVANHFTKWSLRLGDGDFATHALEQLCGEAMRAPQGPVWLDIPKDIQNVAI